MTKPVIILLGPPGSGKTTISEKLSQQFNFDVFCPGAILLKERGFQKSHFAETGTEAGEYLKRKGVFRLQNLAPFVLELLSERLSLETETEGLILEMKPKVSDFQNFEAEVFSPLTVSYRSTTML